MIHPAKPRQLVAHTAIAAAAAVLAVACTTGPGPSSGTASMPTGHARLSYVLPDDPVSMLFPATGAETRWTQGLDVFTQQAARTTMASCARDRGISLPEQPPLAFVRFFELPDLDFIARHGFSDTAAVPTPSATPAANGVGTPDVIRRCRAEGEAAAAALRDAYTPLQQGWFRQIASLRRDSASVRALDALPDCLAQYGFHIRDEDGFFRLVGSRLDSAAPADFPHVERELARAYATCMRPVEAVREPARLRLRARFIADHADQIRELRKSILPSLRHAQEHYDVRLAFPAP